MLNTFFGTIGALDQLERGVKLERKNIEAWYELGKNTMGLVDSLAALQDAMAPKIEGYSPFLKRHLTAITKVSRTVSVLEAGYNLTTGLELLFSDDGAVFSGAFDLIQSRQLARSTCSAAVAPGSGGIVIHPALPAGRIDRGLAEAAGG